MKHTLLAILIASGLIGCASLKLEPANFAWPVESVLKIDSKGMVEDNRYSFSFNVKPLFQAEFNDTTASGEIHLIRDMYGYYYITAAKFKNVYTFVANEGNLSQKNKFLVSETGLSSPAFNQRDQYIQLLNGKEKSIMLSRDGIQQPENKGEQK